MKYTLTKQEEEWIDRQIEVTFQSTPEERLRALNSLQELYMIGANQRGELFSPKEFEQYLSNNKPKQL